MTACDPDLLSRYLDRELALREWQELERHLRACRACRKELSELRALNGVLVSAGSVRVPVPVSTQNRIVSSLERKRRLGPLRHLGGLTHAAFGTCIAALLLVVTMNFSAAIWHGNSSSNDQSAQVQQLLAQQSTPLRNARRTAAITGGRVSAQPPVTNNTHSLPYLN